MPNIAGASTGIERAFGAWRSRQVTTRPLAAEMVYDPENQAEDHAKQDAGNKRKRDGPASTAPIQIAGEAAKRDIKAVEAENDHANYNEYQTKEDEDAAKIGHKAGQLAFASMVAASRRRSEGWQGLVRMPMGWASLSDCSRTLWRLE